MEQNKNFSVWFRFEKVTDKENGSVFEVDEDSTRVFESLLIGAYSERYGKFAAANRELGEDLIRVFCDKICAEILFQKWLDIVAEQASRDKVQSLAGHFNGMSIGRIS